MMCILVICPKEKCFALAAYWWAAFKYIECQRNRLHFDNKNFVNSGFNFFFYKKQNINSTNKQQTNSIKKAFLQNKNEADNNKNKVNMFVNFFNAKDTISH